MGERRRDKGNWSQEMEDWRQEMGVESGGRLGVGWARHQLGTPHQLNVGNSQQSCIMSSNNESFKKKISRQCVTRCFLPARHWRCDANVILLDSFTIEQNAWTCETVFPLVGLSSFCYPIGQFHNWTECLNMWDGLITQGEVVGAHPHPEITETTL